MPTFEFTVPRKALVAAALPVPPRPEGEEASDDEGVVFRFELYPTGRETLRIEQRTDDLNGGLATTMDLQLATSQLGAKAREYAEAVVWPQGRPTDDDGNWRDATPEEEATYRAAWGEAPQVPQLTRLLDMQTRQEILAEWPVLARSIPAGWERPEDLRMPRALLEGIIRAYAAAKLEAATRLGKPQLSGQ